MSLTFDLRLLRQIFGSQARRNVAATGSASLVAAAVSLVAYAVNLRYLGLRSYGVWLALSFIVTLAQLGNLGMAPAVTKYVAEYFGKPEVEKVQQCIASAYLVTIGATLSLVVALTVLRGWVVGLLNLDPNTENMAITLVPWVAGLSAYTVLSQVSTAALSGLGRADLTAVLTAVGRLVALAVAWGMLAAGEGLWSLVVGNFAGSLCTHLAAEWLVRQACPIRLLKRENFTSDGFRRLFVFGTGVVGSSLMQMLLGPLNRLLLTRFAGVESVPIFEVAWGAAMQVRSLLASGLQALLPDFSRAASSGNHNRVRHLLRQAYKLLLAVGVPLYLGLFLAAKLVLGWWLGPGFDGHILPCFRVMLVGSFVSLLGVPAYFRLLGAGRVRDTFTAHFVQSGLSAALAILFAWNGGLSPLLVCFAGTSAASAATVWLLFRGHCARKET